MHRVELVVRRVALAGMGVAFLGFALALVLLLGTEVVVAEVILAVTGVLCLAAAWKLPGVPRPDPEPERDAFGR